MSARRTAALRAAALALGLTLAASAPGADPAADLATDLAAELATAIETYQTRDFTRAAEQLRPLAEAGEPQAQTILGIMYESGEGVPLDHAAAARWYRAAAEQGYDPAQYSLGNLYRAGRGVPRSDQEAAYWYTAAARQGNRWAAARLDAPGGAAVEDYPPSVVKKPERPVSKPLETGISSERLAALVARVPGLRASARARDEPEAAASAPAAGTDPHPEAAAPMAREAPDPVPGAVAGPAPAPRPAAPPATASDGEAVPGAYRGPYRIQIASTRSRERTSDETERVLASLATAQAAAGLEAVIARADLGDDAGVWYRGQVRPFPSLAAAREACRHIVEHAAAGGCIVLRDPDR